VKLTAIKNYLLFVPALLVLLVTTGIELIIAIMELQISRCNYRLQLGVWPQLQTKNIANKPSDKKADSCICQTDREMTIQQILSCWDKKRSRTIVNDRRVFEATKWGQQAIRNNPDRHLYAVLRPTRKENLERIANVLREMDAEAFARVSRNAEKWRCGKY